MGLTSTLLRVILPQAANAEAQQAYELLEKARNAENSAAAIPHLIAFKEIVGDSFQKDIYDLDGIQEILAEQVARAIESTHPQGTQLKLPDWEEILPFLLTAEGEGSNGLLEKEQVYLHLRRQSYEGTLIQIALATVAQRENPSFDVERAWSDYEGIRGRAIHEGAWKGEPYLFLSINGGEQKICSPTEIVYNAARQSIAASIDQSLESVQPEEIASQRYSSWFNHRIAQLQSVAEQLSYSDSNLEETVVNLKARKEKIVEEAKPRIRKLVGEAHDSFMAAKDEDVEKAYIHLGTIVGEYGEVLGIEDYAESMNEYARQKGVVEHAKDNVIGALVRQAKERIERLHDKAYDTIFLDDKVSRGQWEFAYAWLMRLSDDYGEELGIDNPRVYARPARERREALFPKEEIIEHRIS